MEVTRSLFLDDLDDAAVDTIVGRLETATSPMSIGQLRVLGGAMARVPADATAFAHRSARVLFTMITTFEDAAELPRHAEWTAEFAADLDRLSTGVYSNFIADEGAARVHDAYPAATYRRLAEIKRRYDPTNLFHLNQNIAP
jgi:FAD/FMN-containing dehydrogenase